MNVAGFAKYKTDREGFEWPQQIRILGIRGTALLPVHLFDNEETIKDRIYNHQWASCEQVLKLKPYPPSYGMSYKKWQGIVDSVDNTNESSIEDKINWIKDYLSHRCRCAKRLVTVDRLYDDRTFDRDIVILRGKAPCFVKMN